MSSSLAIWTVTTRQSPSANFLQDRRGAPSSKHQLKRADQAPIPAESLCTLNWCIENSSHHCLDWTWDEDRSRIRTGFGPENMTRLRRFAIGLIKGKGLDVAPTVRRLARDVRAVLDFLKMTGNTQPRTPKPAATA